MIDAFEEKKGAMLEFIDDDKLTKTFWGKKGLGLKRQEPFEVQGGKGVGG